MMQEGTSVVAAGTVSAVGHQTAHFADLKAEGLTDEAPVQEEDGADAQGGPLPAEDDNKSRNVATELSKSSLADKLFTKF